MVEDITGAILAVSFLSFVSMRTVKQRYPVNKVSMNNPCTIEVPTASHYFKFEIYQRCRNLNGERGHCIKYINSCDRSNDLCNEF
jgi:heme/copper-type cytochrome/quinol oxidase subunit 2